MTTAAGDERAMADALSALLMDIHTFQRNLLLRRRLSLGQYIGLRFVRANEPVSMSALAEFGRISRPSTTVIVNLMERKGWVRRSRSVDDQRSVHLRLTPKAVTLLREMDDEMREFLVRAFTRLPKDHRPIAARWIEELDGAVRAELDAPARGAPRGEGA